jgi:hypothetical protein
MAKLFNRALMTTATTGTGTITLGSAVTRHQSFSDAGVQNGDLVPYVIEDGSNWEIGIGTYASSGTTLARTTVLESTNSDNAINLSGSAQVMIAPVAVGGLLRVEGLELGHASDTTITRVSAGLVAIEGVNVVTISATQTLTNKTIAAANNTLTGVAVLATENQALSGGFTVTPKDLGTTSSGTRTLDIGDRPLQKYVNNGAHTFAPGTVVGACIVTITNDASAGAITPSGWTDVSGDAFDTTDNNKFRCHCAVDDDGDSTLIVEAMQ